MRLEPQAAQPGRSLIRTLGWSIFLGCSWTWCIGMFLPVLLVRDLGAWGWVIFAAPNVVGAAAMGWVLRDARASGRIVNHHAAACVAFSIVTIAFHVFFTLWFIPRLVGLPIAGVTFVLAAVYLIATGMKPGWDLPAAALVWAVSLAMFGIFVRRAGGAPFLPSPGVPGAGIAWLAPVCVFGFLFCPYLDLTFHRARQQTDRGHARVAFGVGFGVVFLAMIVFSLVYARRLAPLIVPDWRRHLWPMLGGIIAAHMIAQIAFTLAVHTRSAMTARTRGGAVLGLVVAAQVALLLGVASWMLPRYHGLDFGEVVYRLFMGFYGLVFPAYVGICMVPGRDGESGMSAAKLRALALGVAVAAPMYWMGFVEGRMVWLVPGLAVVILARFTVPKRQGARRTDVRPLTGN